MNRVIDISDYQEGIDFDLVVSEGITGVIIKFSEGLSETDCYYNFVSECVARDIPYGVYCYSHATTIERAEEEANFIIDMISAVVSDGYPAPQLGIWYDVEDQAMLSLSRYDLTQVVTSFISTCNSKDYMAGIYAGYYTLRDNIDIESLADYVPYWIADYDKYCGFYDFAPSNKRLVYWQFTDQEYIGDTNVDMNYDMEG